MTDETIIPGDQPPQPPAPGPAPGNAPDDAAKAARDAARKKRDAELFGDLEDEEIHGDTPEETIEGLRTRNAELLEQIAKLADCLTKSQADNLTLHTRAEEAKKLLTRQEAKAEQDKKFALEKFVKDVLPVIDTLELGLKAIPQKDRDADPKFAKLAEGIDKTVGQLTAVFNKYGIRSIDPLNQPFDSSKHEALTAQHRDGVDPETVIHVAQKGYEIEGRLIRPAKVIITPPE